ncbi:pseudouridine synthase [Chitinophaga filiformis]|uniref:Pseudouridine synthase n=1 Tax=Chitinophaga filiformis TaxID=104663 RepID=A0A1G7U3N6_CHIFI|nr:pseudouridine synthase [Chitinophaga filiformis]SDG42047.1 23S rRNA pseudouridine2605 synthase [Chitinophaga filiformis]
MRKNTPAKKGFSPFKENKNSSSNKPTRANAADRKRGNDEDTRPGRGDAKKSTRPFGTDRKRDNNDNGRPAGKPERTFPSDHKRDNNDDTRPGRGDARKSTRSFGTDRKRDNDENSRPAKRTEGKPERSFPSDRKPKDDRPFRPGKTTEGKPERTRSANASEIPGTKRSERDKTERRPRIEPVRKTANGRTPFKPRPQSDDSAFHGPSERKAGKRGSSREERATPSGFNRKKYFDSANERFADKQDRKSAVRKARHSEDSAPFGKKSSKKEESSNNPGEMPLNKYIAHSGLCSRRKAVDFVKEGKVTVNGKLVTEPAFKVTAKDDVAISNKRITIQKNLVYILLNKPKGYITTTDDPEGRKTVMELIEDAVTDDQRVYPVGRLDRNTSGLLLLTNDGELAQKLAHPKHNIKKIYHVGLNKPLTKADFEKILQGVTLEDGIANVDALGYVEAGDKTQVGIEIHSGKNRIVRRIFEHLEYDVEKLDRVTYAGLTKKNINRGKWRFLTEKEIILLKHFK